MVYKMKQIRPMRKGQRKFKGVTYWLSGTAKPRTKANARKDAKGIRKKGKARIIKCKGGYRVFGR